MTTMTTKITADGWTLTLEAIPHNIWGPPQWSATIEAPNGRRFKGGLRSNPIEALTNTQRWTRQAYGEPFTDATAFHRACEQTTQDLAQQA